MIPKNNKEGKKKRNKEKKTKKPDPKKGNNPTNEQKPIRLLPKKKKGGEKPK